jgi:hypothetical protein
MESKLNILQKQKNKPTKEQLNKQSDYVIAIPSYKRVETLEKKTLALLQKYKIPSDKIYIFVADEKEKKEYTEGLSKYYREIVVGKPGIKNIRNFMPNHFKEGKKIFYMDDDCYSLHECVIKTQGKSSKSKKSLKKSKSKKKSKSSKLKKSKKRDKSNQKLKPLKNLDEFIKTGFHDLSVSGMNLFGIYPVDNAFFMRPTDNRGKSHLTNRICYIIGYCAGAINTRVCEERTVDDKEDFERSIKYYLHDGGVLRYNNITAKTRCYKEPGGMQEERTKARVKRSALYLNKKYPDLTTYTEKKSWGFAEVILRDKRVEENRTFGLKTLNKYENNGVKY